MEAISAGFTWQDFVDDLVGRVGSLTAVAERLAADKGFTEDVGSIERALRRLRARGQEAGGKWGARLLATFGLPGSVEARLRWMAAYHSRFTDLPVPVADDLLRLWEHPPTTERREARAFLALARASLDLRKNDKATALARLEPLLRELDRLPAEARVELLLVRAFVASATHADEVEGWLAQVPAALAQMTASEDRACLAARFADQRAYEANRRGDFAAAEALYRALPADDAPPFVLCRRANGLAYALHRQGRDPEAAVFAREAARHAGDGGHVRLRVMALSMLARIDPGEAAARERALTISRRLEDETLLLRLGRGSARAVAAADLASRHGSRSS